MRRPERRFYFHLAETLHMPVATLLDTISSPELTEWMAWFRYKENPPKKPQTSEEARAVMGAMVQRKRN